MLIASSLSIYTVHVRPSDIGHPDRIRFVREGFSFYGFIFGFFWALYHGLWRWALTFFVFNAAMGWAAEARLMDSFSLMMIQISVQILFGFHAQDVLRAALQRKGFVMTALVSGENQMRAEQRFFDHHTDYLSAAQA